MATILNCLQCSIPVRVPQYRVDTFKYCSRKCAALHQRVHVNAICLTCSAPFTHISSRANKAKYCSRKCYHKAVHLMGSVIHSCKHCGKSFRSPPSHKRVYCSKACVGKSSKAIWNPDFTTVRKKMAQRDMIKSCERCGYDSEPRILGVHHKDRDRKNNEMSNLEVLCPNCHSLEHIKHTPHGFKE